MEQQRGGSMKITVLTSGSMQPRKCRPRIIKPRPFQGLNIRIPIMIYIQGRVFLICVSLTGSEREHGYLGWGLLDHHVQEIFPVKPQFVVFLLVVGREDENKIHVYSSYSTYIYILPTNSTP